MMNGSMHSNPQQTRPAAAGSNTMRLPFTFRSLQEERSQIPHGALPSIPQTQAYVAIDSSSLHDATILRNSGAFRSLSHPPQGGSPRPMTDEKRSGNVHRPNGGDMAITTHPQSQPSRTVFKAQGIIGHVATSSNRNSLFDIDSATNVVLDLKEPKTSESHPIGTSTAEFSRHLASMSPQKETYQFNVSPLRCRRAFPVVLHRPVPPHVECTTNSSDSVKELPQALSPFPSYQEKFTPPMMSDSFGGHAPIMVGQRMKLSCTELKKRGEIAESSKKKKCPAVGALSSTGRSKLGRRGSKAPHEQLIVSQNHQLEWASYQNSKLLDMNSTLQKILLVKDKTIQEMGKQLHEKKALLTTMDDEKENVPRDHKIAWLETKVEDLQARIVHLELSVDGNLNGQTDTPTSELSQRQHQTPKTGHRRSKRVTCSASKNM